MRHSNCAGAMLYVPEIMWFLFLRILDMREENEAETPAELISLIEEKQTEIMAALAELK